MKRFRTSGLTALSALSSSLTLLLQPTIAGDWKGTVGEPLRDSSEEALVLADHLRSVGARFFGAWTCPACFRQMNLFGKQAGAQVPYVECRKPKKLPQQAASCDANGIRAYPTWVLRDGSRREGIQSIEALSSWSGLN